MTETIFDPGGCVGCDTDGRCMGKTNCKYCYSEIHYCDECGKEINDEFFAQYGVNMNGHSAESYTVVWIFKTAIEAAGSTDGEAVRDAIAALDIKGEFPGGRKIVLPYDEIKFENYELAGAPHFRDNTSASVAIAQVQDGEWKTVWPFDFTDTKILYPAPLQ